jgi:hypothetical protein
LNLTSVDGNGNNTAEGNVTTGVVTVNGFEHVTVNANVASADADVETSQYQETTTLIAHDLSTLTISGNASIQVKGTGTDGSDQLGDLTSSQLTTIDASHSTGNVTIDYSLAHNVTYLGSAGSDHITAPDSGTVYGGGSNDQITLVHPAIPVTATPDQFEVQTLSLPQLGKGMDTVGVLIFNPDGTSETVRTGEIDTTSRATIVSALQAAINADEVANKVVTAGTNNAGDLTLIYKVAGSTPIEGFNGDVDASGNGPVGGSFSITTSYVAGHHVAATLQYKAASDAQVKVGSDGTHLDAAGAASVETISGFASSADANPPGSTTTHVQDVFDFLSIGGFTGQTVSVMSVASVDPFSGSFLASQANFFQDSSGKHDVAVDQFGGNTFVFVDADHNGGFDASHDMVLKLAGTHTLSAADFVV